MARVLFLPVLLIILAIVAVLALRLKSMFIMSKSKDIVLSGAVPFEGDIWDIVNAASQSIKSMAVLQYQSEIHADFHQLKFITKITASGRSCKIDSGRAIAEINLENNHLVINAGRNNQKSVPRDNPWVDYWCGLSTPDESLALFRDEGFKISAGNRGSYQQRAYTEIIVLAHALPPVANQAFELCHIPLRDVFGKALAAPGLRVRNFMARFLINNITYLPDFIEIKFNIFNNDDFVCDYLQNSRLLY